MELTIEQLLQQGVAAHKEGKLQDAERLYRAIIQSQPAHPDANHNLGVLAVSINKADAALPLIKIALEANPKIEQFWLSYIDALIKDNQIKDAKKVLEQAKKQGVDVEKLNALEAQLTSFKEPQNVGSVIPSETQLDSLLKYYLNGRFGEAEKLAISLTQEFPKHQFGWKVLGSVLGKTGRKSEAVNANQTAVILSPQDAEAHSNLGVTLQELGRLDEAEASCTQAIALKPDLADAHYNLGVTLKELGRLDEAEATYKQAIVLKPDYALAHNNLGVALKELGRLDEAETSYKQAIALKPNYAQAHNNLGITLKELGRLDEAGACYTQAIALKPNYASAITNKWLLLFNKKEFEAALSHSDSHMLKEARAFDLITLYALGRINEIYKRIEIQSKIDGENICIAAFAAFISEAEKKATAYKFCPEPINFVHFSNLASHMKDSGEYITGVIKELDKVKTVWEPAGQSTVSGFQSSTLGKNLFESPSKKIAQLKSIIINEIKAYYLKYHSESCSYIQKLPSGKNLFGWHVILKNQGYQTAHIHRSGWLSGVIYLKVVPSLGKDEGAIEFSLNGEHYSNINSPNLTHHPEVGDIVFFPSSLHHRTIPFTTDSDRIIISFDLMPEATKT